MQSIVTNIGLIVGGAIDWIGDYIGCITATGNELLLFFTIFGFVGTGIGLIHRIIRIN